MSQFAELNGFTAISNAFRTLVQSISIGMNVEHPLASSSIKYCAFVSECKQKISTYRTISTNRLISNQYTHLDTVWISLRFLGTSPISKSQVLNSLKSWRLHLFFNCSKKLQNFMPFSKWHFNFLSFTQKRVKKQRNPCKPNKNEYIFFVHVFFWVFLMIRCNDSNAH